MLVFLILQNNFDNNHRSYSPNPSNSYGNSYGNRSIPTKLGSVIKVFIATQKVFNITVGEKLKN